MAWLTNTKTGGIFNTDWADKDSQIARNQAVADELNGRTFHGVSIDHNNAMPDRPTGINGDEFIQQVTGVDPKTARDIHGAILNWSDYGSGNIHREIAEKDYEYQGWNTGEQDAKLIDQYLNSPGVPKYKGELYRGIRVSQSQRDSIESMIKSGKWKESGITSFTYDRAQADLYSSPSSMDDRVTIVLRNNKHASTIGHLSVGGGEKEALYPSSIKNGIKIKSYTKEPEYFDKFDRAHFRETGERRFNKTVLRYVYTIFLEDE